MKKQVYYNGTILTMENPSQVEAIYVKNGIIEKVGTAKEMLKYKKTDTEMIDLEGKTLLPGFIDTHGHFISFANSLCPITTFAKQKPGLSILQDFNKGICAAQNIYFNYGITTAQEGYMRELEWEILRFSTNNKFLKLDILGYVDLKEHKQIMKKHSKYTKHPIHHLKLGGYKLFLDGELKRETAWLTKPYSDSKVAYRGNSIYSDEELRMMLAEVFKEEKQLLIHCNGDAAVDQLIRTYFTLLKEPTHTRPVLIHAEFLRADQIARLKRFGVILCYCISNLYYSGDKYVKYLGHQRASHISPLNTTYQLKAPYTLQTNTRLGMPNILHAIWCAVNRVTQDGVILGEEEKITPLEALKAVTIQAAHQYFQEDIKGSLKEGKLADLVILDKNPLEIDPMQIKHIEVIQTIKEGNVVYTKPHYKE